MAIKEKIADYSVGGLVGMTLAAIVNLGIFATKADIAQMETRMYQEFMPKQESIQKFDVLEKKIDKLLDAVYKK